MRKNVPIVLLIAFIVLVACAILLFYLFIHGATNPLLKKAEVSVGGNIFRVEIAQTSLERSRGLSGRDGLAEGSGMFFIFDAPSAYGFWMKDMKFPIDIIWINGDRVVGIALNAAPEPGKPVWGLKIYYPPEPVDRVLEVNAGDAAKYGIKAGSAVVFRE
jgi:hypothetical protein